MPGADHVLVFEGLGPELPSDSLIDADGFALVDEPPAAGAPIGAVGDVATSGGKSPKNLLGIGLAVAAGALALGAAAWTYRRSTRRTVTLAYQEGCEVCAEFKPRFREAKEALEEQGITVVEAETTQDPLYRLPNFPTVPAIAVTEGTRGRILYGDKLNEWAGENFEKLTPERIAEWATAPLAAEG